MKTDYIDQKQYRYHKHQQNKNKQKTKIGRKATIWASYAINKRKISQENLNMAKRETEFLLIAAQNNAIRTNNVKAKK